MDVAGQCDEGGVGRGQRSFMPPDYVRPRSSSLKEEEGSRRSTSSMEPHLLTPENRDE